MVVWKQLNRTNRSRAAWRTARWLAGLLVLMVGACGDENPIAPEQAALSSQAGPSAPEGVSDLSVVSATESSVTVSWTQGDDGTGNPADYTVRYHLTPIGYGWGQATIVMSGACASPISGTEVGEAFTCTVEGLEEGVTYDFRLVSYRQGPNGRTFGPLSNVATGTAELQKKESRPVEKPGQVTDLSVVEDGESSVALSWTQVDDGTGSPAEYTVRHHPTPIGYGWGQATIVGSGECASPIQGTEVGETLTCTVNDLDEDTSHDFRLVSYRKEDDERIFGPLSNVATGATRPEGNNESDVDQARPDQVTDLSVAEGGDSSVTLTWTQVDDGTGSPAEYTVRYVFTPLGYGWGQATIVSSGECASPIQGSRVGEALTCTVNGLDEGRAYDFRLVSYRHDDGERIFGELSNVASAETELSSTTEDTTPVDGGSNPSGGSSNLYPNEPSGFTDIAQRRYQNGLQTSGWRTDADNPNLSIVSDPTAPVFGPEVARIRYAAGSTGGRSPAWDVRTIRSEGATSLYVSYWVKVSDNWYGHPTRVNKIGFIWTHDKPVVYPMFRGRGNDPLEAWIYLQDSPSAGRLEPNLGNDGRLTRGQWHQWEIVLVQNTGSNQDGQVHWWVDGQKVGEYQNIQFGTASQSKAWEHVMWRPIWGGRDGTVPQTQYMSLDHLYISGSP